MLSSTICSGCYSEINYEVSFAIGGDAFTKSGCMKCPGCNYISKNSLILAPAFVRGTRYLVVKEEVKFDIDHFGQQVNHPQKSFDVIVFENPGCLNIDPPPYVFENDYKTNKFPDEKIFYKDLFSNKTKLEVLGIDYEKELKKIASEQSTVSKDKIVQPPKLQHQRKIPLDFD